MGRLRKPLLAMQVWLTAFVTLAAGLPHEQCRCPNGALKLFCFAGLADKDDCCAAPCGAAHAGACAGTKAKRHTCCHTRRESPPTADRLTAPGCARSAAPLPVYLPASEGSSSVAVQAILSPTASALLGVAVITPTAHLATAWQSALPPPDLLTLHQHLLI